MKNLKRTIISGFIFTVIFSCSKKKDNNPKPEEPIVENLAPSAPTWQSLNSNTTYNLYSTYFLNENEGWAAGGPGVVLGTKDGGDTWTKYLTGGTNTLLDVKFFDKNAGYAGGYDGVFKTYNGGISWKKINSDYNWATLFIDSLNGWVAGYDYVSKTIDGGKTWKKTTFTSGTGTVTDIFFFDSKNGFMVGSSGGGLVKKTINGGDTWTDVFLPITCPLYGIDFVSLDKGVTVGKLSYTWDNSGLWGTNIKSYAWMYDVDMIDDKKYCAVGDSGKVFMTENSGSTWNLINIGTTKKLNSVFFVNSKKAYICGASGTIIKYNGK